MPSNHFKSHVASGEILLVTTESMCYVWEHDRMGQTKDICLPHIGATKLVFRIHFRLKYCFASTTISTGWHFFTVLLCSKFITIMIYQMMCRYLRVVYKVE